MNEEKFLLAIFPKTLDYLARISKNNHYFKTSFCRDLTISNLSHFVNEFAKESYKGITITGSLLSVKHLNLTPQTIKNLRKMYSHYARHTIYDDVILLNDIKKINTSFNASKYTDGLFFVAETNRLDGMLRVEGAAFYHAMLYILSDVEVLMYINKYDNDIISEYSGEMYTAFKNGLIKTIINSKQYMNLSDSEKIYLAYYIYTNCYDSTNSYSGPSTIGYTMFWKSMQDNIDINKRFINTFKDAFSIGFKKNILNELKQYVNHYTSMVADLE